MAERFAKEHNLKTIIYLPDWKENKRGAGIIRNTDIVNDSTHMIAFPSKVGKGSQDSIRKAEKKGTPLKILYID